MSLLWVRCYAGEYKRVEWRIYEQNENLLVIARRNPQIVRKNKITINQNQQLSRQSVVYIYIFFLCVCVSFVLGLSVGSRVSLSPPNLISVDQLI